MPDLQTILDIPRTLDDTELPTVRMVVAKLGGYSDKRYGKFAITDEHLSSWQRNLAELPDGQAPIDFDHSPEKGQGTKAAGWITNLERKTGAQLQTEDPGRFKKLDPAAVYAASMVELSKSGADAVRNREYRYISPTFVDNYTDEAGAAKGPALIGAGMTNRPFLKRGMPAISLSEDDWTPAAEDPDDRSDSRGRMSLSTIAKRLGLPEDADEAKILEALPTGDGKVIVLSLDDYAGMVSRAAAGDNATKSLAETRFKTAWDKAIVEVRVAPASEQAFKTLADADLDLAVKTLDELPKLALNTSAKGEGTPTPNGGTVTLDGNDVDADRQDLDERTRAKLLTEGVTEDDPKFGERYVAVARTLEAAGAR